MNQKLKNYLRVHFIISIILSVLLVIIVSSTLLLDRIHDNHNDDSNFVSLFGFAQASSAMASFPLWVTLIIMSAKINGESKESSTLVLFSIIYIPLLSIYFSYIESKNLKDFVSPEVATQTMLNGTQSPTVAPQPVVKVSMDHNEKKLHAAFRKKLLSDDEYEFQSNLYKKLKSKEITNDEYSKLLKASYKKNT